MAVARVGAGPLSVKCRICGRASPRGAKLCDQCVAAVKRARHVRTITSELLPQSGPGVASRSVTAARSAQGRAAAPWLRLPTKPGGWGLLTAFVAFGLAVAVTAYLAVEEIADSAVALRMQSTALDPSGARPSAPPAPGRTTSDGIADEVESVDPTASGSAPVISASLPPAQVSEQPAGRKAASENRTARASARANQAAYARNSESVAVTAPANMAEASAPPATIATDVVTPEPPVTDRWETMSAALAACSRENFLTGVVCAERVRFQYCEGFWGQVPHCRAATRPGASR